MKQKERTLTTFRIDPELLETGKQTTLLAETDLLTCAVMVSTHGGENYLHAHPDLDQLFVVLNGQATFYTEVDQVGAVIGQWEGVVVPHQTAYWYEATSEQNLVLLRIGAHPVGGPQPHIRISENLRGAVPIKTLDGKRFGD
jgi:mannose-6-phosphate isomerase-like protein (cupin superfamily)